MTCSDRGFVSCRSQSWGWCGRAGRRKRRWSDTQKGGQLPGSYWRKDAGKWQKSEVCQKTGPHILLVLLKFWHCNITYHEFGNGCTNFLCITSNVLVFLFTCSLLLGVVWRCVIAYFWKSNKYRSFSFLSFCVTWFIWVVLVVHWVNKASIPILYCVCRVTVSVWFVLHIHKRKNQFPMCLNSKIFFKVIASSRSWISYQIMAKLVFIGRWILPLQF